MADRDIQNQNTRKSEELAHARKQLLEGDCQLRDKYSALGKRFVDTIKTSAQSEDLSILYEVADRSRGIKLDYTSVIAHAAKSLTEIGTPESDTLVSKLLLRKHAWQGTHASIVYTLTERADNGDSNAVKMLDTAARCDNSVIRSLVLHSVSYQRSASQDRYLKEALVDVDWSVAETSIRKIEKLNKIEKSGLIQKSAIDIALGKQKVLPSVRERMTKALATIAKVPEAQRALRNLAQSGELPYREFAKEILQSTSA